MTQMDVSRRDMLMFGAATLALPNLSLVKPTQDTKEAVDKGMQWLMRAKHIQGYWGCEKDADPSAAVTGLATMALMANQNRPFQIQAIQATKWLLDLQKEDGIISVGKDFTGLGVAIEHVAATLALVEFYGGCGRGNNQLMRPLQKALDHLHGQQNPDGGFPSTTYGDPSDIAITAFAHSVMRGARQAGLIVKSSSMDKVRAYTEQCRAKTHGYVRQLNIDEYDYGEYHEGYGPHINFGYLYSAGAGLRVVRSQDGKDDAHTRKTVEMLLKHDIGSEYAMIYGDKRKIRLTEWDYVGAMLSTHAMILRDSDEDWRTWYDKISKFLVSQQNPDGSWTVDYCIKCRAFATSLSLLVLQAPGRALPMWQL